MTACERIGWVEVDGRGWVAWHCGGLWGAALRLSELSGTWSDAAEVLPLALELSHDDPHPIVYAGRVQQWVQRHVPYVPDAQGWYRGEVFKSPGSMLDALNQGGDCDDQARLVFALLVAAGVPSWLMFLGTDQFPEHVCAQAGIGPAAIWLETTIPASLGEHPIVALLRRRKVQ